MIRMADDARFLKKHVKWCDVDVHPTEKAILVRYELEATIMGDAGNAMLGESKECTKIIRLKDLSESTDVSALAREVVKKCKLIPTTKTAEIEQLIFYLQKRKESGHNLTLPTHSTNYNVEVASGERASINKLEEYTALLYEGVPEKVRGTGLIVQLAKNPNNLEEMINNETLLGALARVLREDFKKNYAIATNITCIFYCFSIYNQFHSMISHFKVGALCLQIIDFEIQRHQMMHADMKKKMADTKAKAKFEAMVQQQGKLLKVCTHLLLNLAQDGKVEQKMVNRGIVPHLCQMLERKNNRPLILIVCTFLAKLSLFVENKDLAAKNNVLEKVSKVLTTINDSDNELIAVILQLLLNLSFDTALRSKAISLGIVTHVANLATKETLPDDDKNLALQVLYMYSTHDECKSMLTYTDVIALCMGKALMTQEDDSTLQSVSLLINCAIDKRNAQLIAGENGKGLQLVLDSAFQRQDILLLKLARNIARHDDAMIQSKLVEYAADLALLVTKYLIDDNIRLASNAEQRGGVVTKEWRNFVFALSALGVLSQIKHHQLDWMALAQHCQLVEWMRLALKPTTVDDVMLEAVVLIGTIVSTDQSCAQFICDQQLVEPLIFLLSERQEDDEIVLQIIYAFYQMMFFESVRLHLLNNTQIPAYLIDLMHDKNAHIRRMCDSTLEVVAEAGIEWAARITEERFRWHNAQWLEMVGINDGEVIQIHDDYQQNAFIDSSDENEVLQADDLLDSYDEDTGTEAETDDD